MCLENTNRLFRQANLVNEFANVCTIFDYPGPSEFAVLANAVHTPSLGVFNMGSRLGEHIVSCYYFYSVVLYANSITLCTRNGPHQKHQVYNKLYGTHCQRHVVFRVAQLRRPPVKYNAFNNNYSAESRQGQLYALLASTRSRSLIT